MNNKERITLITVCDNNVPMLLGTLIKSIEANYKLIEPIDFYIVSDKISKKNKKKLQACCDTSIIAIKWLELRDILTKNSNIPIDSTTYPLNIYTRLFIPYFMPHKLKKTIYLDVDMLLLKDISELWNVDIGDNIIGAVQEPNGIIKENVKNWEQLKLSPDDPYFNSGMLIINNEKWRHNCTTKSVLKCIRDNKRYALYPDQYGINIALSNETIKIDSKWNTFSNVMHPDPAIIHFIGYKPIYKDYEGRDDYLKKFKSYYAMTPWANIAPKSKHQRHSMKLNRKMNKCLISFFKLKYHY